MNESQWWQHKYNRLVAECFEPVPFDLDDHDDCDLIQFMNGDMLCATCPTQYRVKE